MKHYNIDPVAKCWYVKTDEAHIEVKSPMTYLQALLVADFLVANRHKGVEVYKGQPSIFTTDNFCP